MLRLDPLAPDGGESRQRKRDGVRSRAQVDDAIQSLAIGDCCTRTRDQCGAAGLDRYTRQHRTRRVSDDAGDAALRERGSGDHEHAKRDEGKKEFIALFSDPTNPTPEITARNLGQAYLEEKNYPEALNWFRTAITRAKNYADGYLGSADAFLGMGRLEDAIQTLESGHKEMPDDPQINLALGQAYFQAGRFSEARQMLEAASRREPNGPAGRRAAELLKTFPK